METIKIEKGVPVPERQTGVSATLRSMEINDSVEIPKSAVKTWRSTAQLLKLRISVRSPKGSNTARVWRVVGKPFADEAEGTGA